MRLSRRRGRWLRRLELFFNTGRKGRKSCAKDAKNTKRLFCFQTPINQRLRAFLFAFLFCTSFLRLLRNFCALCVRYLTLEHIMTTAELPLFEVFIRSKQGLEHKHCGSLHASDAQQALQMARDVYTRRMEGVSIWVIPSNQITASQPDDKEEMFEPASDKIYRHPTFYDIPDEVGHM
jgi:ring-1,2-phenylacetyl-CoA epoxidase subunit PaaB